MKKRVIFATIWSIATVLGFMIYMKNLSPIGYLMGFHLPKDMLLVSTVVGLYSDYPQKMFLFFIILIVFVIVWVIAMIRIRKSKLFEVLIVCDNVVSLLLWFVLYIVNGGNYAYPIYLLIETMIIICLIWICKDRGKTGDDSLS